jgi:hypothetical protein
MHIRRNRKHADHAIRMALLEQATPVVWLPEDFRVEPPREDEPEARNFWEPVQQ